MSEDDLIAVDQMLADLQERRVCYVKRLTALDPSQDANDFTRALRLIDELNAALIRISGRQARE